MFSINFIGHTVEQWYADESGDVRKLATTVKLYSREEIESFQKAVASIGPGDHSLTFHFKNKKWELGQ